MALDEAMWVRAEEGSEGRVTVRLYAWSPACFSLGYHQALRDACDTAFCEREGIGIVRRPTGGKAVLHDDEVTYSVVAPFDAPPFAGGGLLEAYETIARALAEGLGRLGLAVILEERAVAPPPTGSDPCFLVPSPKELLSGGRKVAGSAQKRGRRAFLQHGAVPLSIDYERLALASGRPVRDAARFREAFAGAADLLPGVTAEALRRELAAGFARVFGGEAEGGGASAEESSLAQTLAVSRYSTQEWTEGARPPVREIAAPGRPHNVSMTGGDAC
jgi:lipoate-protein ligase A